MNWEENMGVHPDGRFLPSTGRRFWGFPQGDGRVLGASGDKRLVGCPEHQLAGGGLGQFTKSDGLA